MYKTAIITLCNSTRNNEKFNLIYDISSLSIAQKWAECVKSENKRKLVIHEGGWWHGFDGIASTNGYDGPTRSRLTLSKQLNEHIKIINEYYPDSIVERAEEYMSQQTMNILHHYFEVYRGGILSPGFMWRDGDNKLRNSLEKLNELIHRYETFYRNEKNTIPRLSVMWRHPTEYLTRRDRFPLPDKDFKHFKLGRFFGQLYLHYCEVGKPILDTFFDQDDVIFDDNITPLRYYSCDFDCYFHNGWSDEKAKEIKTKLLIWLERNNFDKNDLKLSIGHLSLAKLNKKKTEGFKNLNNDEIVQAISKYLKVDQVNVE